MICLSHPIGSEGRTSGEKGLAEVLAILSTNECQSVLEDQCRSSFWPLSNIRSFTLVTRRQDCLPAQTVKSASSVIMLMSFGTS
jgi:hypothetical protein